VSKRILRVNVLIKEEVSKLLLKEFEFSLDVLVTVTRVETSADLKESKVFISVIPEEKSDEVIKILNKKMYFLQQKFNQRMKMRPLPRLKILAEKKTIEASMVEEILEKLKKEQK